MSWAMRFADNVSVRFLPLQYGGLGGMVAVVAPSPCGGFSVLCSWPARTHG